MPDNVRIALVGFGKMGRLIEQLAQESGCEVCLTIRSEDNVEGSALTASRLEGVDVAIEFTHPDAVLRNLECLSAARVNTVCGTTGWFAHLPRVQQQFEATGTGLVWSANFSTGVQVFSRLVAAAAQAFQAAPGYEAWAWEIHHSAKQDAPSGTLLRLVEQMRHKGWTAPVDVSSSRAGAHPGTHEIGFDSSADTLTLRHTARSREGFARGALHAARWIQGKRGCFEYGDILFDGR